MSRNQNHACSDDGHRPSAPASRLRISPVRAVMLKRASLERRRAMPRVPRLLGGTRFGTRNGVRVWLLGLTSFAVLAASSVLHSAWAQSGVNFEAGKIAFRQCRACHSLSPSQNGRGPTLYRVFGRRAGTVPGYLYSTAMRNAATVWTTTTLEQYLSDPRELIPGNKMEFAGIKDRKQLQQLLAYLRQATK
jgi:cytochrome c